MDNQQEDILTRLERIAEQLDEQQYPGEAWPVAARPARRINVWHTAGVIAAVAAAVALAIHLVGTQPPLAEVVPGSHDSLVHEPATPLENTSEEVSVPAILVVEDFDSYSFIDLMADVPLVSFAKRDTYMPECVVPLLPDAAMQLPLENDM